MRDIPEPDRKTLLATLRTKVFDVADGLARPVHRHVAEFLAGRFLSRLVDDGLPVRRVLALLTGDDGLAEPALFVERLRQKLNRRGRERRVRHVAAFLYDRDMPSIDVLDIPALELLIESLGNSYRPLGWPGDGSGMTGNMAAKDSAYTGLIVDSLLINALSSRPDHQATAALERLSKEDTLRPWRLKLRDALSRQREVRREVYFRHPSVEQVLETLANRYPANAADLAALTMDILSSLGREIHDGNTSDWRQYWNVDLHNRAQDPKPEEACRDALLSDLRQRLAPKGVHAQPEGTYADDKRADICVSYNGFNVPTEIKKSSHDDLWKAIRSQLIEKYTRDPGASGATRSLRTDCAGAGSSRW